MGIGNVNFKSDSIEYSTPSKLINPLIKEFNLLLDVCASELNHKLDNYFTKEDNSLLKDWNVNCWMNPPFTKDLKKWVIKAKAESHKHNVIVVCLIPVRSNTVWWKNVCLDSEIRFINGEVNFNDEIRGLWLPMCIMIFGSSNTGKFSVIDYRDTKSRAGDSNKKI